MVTERGKQKKPPPKHMLPRITGHSYFLKDCPDTQLKFSGFKLHHRQENHRIPTVSKQSAFDDILGHKSLQEHGMNLKYVLVIFMGSAVVYHIFWITGYV